MPEASDGHSRRETGGHLGLTGERDERGRQIERRQVHGLHERTRALIDLTPRARDDAERDERQQDQPVPGDAGLALQRADSKSSFARRK
jgi:hypothetical protein